MKFVLIVDILDIRRSTAVGNTFKNGDCFNNIYRSKRWLDDLSTSLLDRYWTRRQQLFLCYAPRSDSLDRNGTILLAYSFDRTDYRTKYLHCQHHKPFPPINHPLYLLIKKIYETTMQSLITRSSSVANYYFKILVL